MPQNLDTQKTNDLIHFVECLNKLEIPYFLTNGTLLGCIRDGKFIEWDSDIDIDTTQKALNGKLETLISELRILGFNGYLVRTRNYPKIVCKRESIKISFGGFKETKKYFKRASYIYPKELFIDNHCNTRLAVLNGVKFKVPIRSEELLTYMYGNWVTPICSSNEDQYSTKNHYVKPYPYRKFRTLKYRFLTIFQKTKF